MARILDALHRSERRNNRDEKEAKIQRADAPATSEIDEESDVPFIEIGGPTPKMQLKMARAGKAPIPTILPLARPTTEYAKPAAESVPLYRISFQPLPFPQRPDHAAEHGFSRELVAYHQPTHAISEQYRDLLARIESQLEANGAKALLFTSATAGAGTTSVMLNLAATTARREGNRVIVVDANRSRPAVAARVGVAPAPGLAEVLARTVPLAWGIQNTDLANLHVLAAGQSQSESAMDLWPIVLDQLRNRFDWVMIDAAEWGRPELQALAGTASATYLVVPQADIEAPELNDLLVKVPGAGAQLRGYVLVSKD